MAPLACKIIDLGGLRITTCGLPATRVVLFFEDALTWLPVCEKHSEDQDDENLPPYCVLPLGRL